MGEHRQKSTWEPDPRPVSAIAKEVVLGPLYFVLLTLFGLWPWRFGSPFFLPKPLRIPRNAQRTFVLRLLVHRLLLRDDRLLRKDTWCLLSAYRLKRWLRSPWFTDHPTTGNRVVGIELPYWQETLELCKSAHATAFSSFPTVGWDVAITPEGPVLVEMNIQWVRPAGLPDEPFSGQTAYVDCILAHIQRYWPEQLPGPDQERNGP